MTNSPTSSSDGEASSAFRRLHPRLQRWVHDEGWTSLHDAQELAIAPILDAEHDVIISAATAAGKTEAAFLPICSTLARLNEAPVAERDPWTAHDPWAEPTRAAAPGVQVLYLSPLKALINDQFRRLEQMCERAGVSVHRWHGDVAGSSKQKMLAAPSGVLLITPESLEALFVNRGTTIPTLFGGLRYVVVDELHSFLATPRGAQLQSLMHRVELAVRRRVPRIGLSATLGDMAAAAAFLRPSNPARVVVISSQTESRGLQLQLRGYVATPPPMSPRRADADSEGFDADNSESSTGDRSEIADHLFRTLRGRDNLVFANARRDVEIYADLLARRCDDERVPVEFWPHHGSLSRDMRESVEAQLRDRSRPATAICTSTLEMGIDIGSVSSVAQIGPPPSVASLRQRLGRSGRRDDPAVIRLYVSEEPLDSRASHLVELRCHLTQSIAMVNLMLERWLEAPDDPGFNYSTLIQQVLSTIAQHGGAKPIELYRALCGPGPFGLVDQARFARLLRSMAANDLIIQASDDLLLHGVQGERHVNHYSFYTAFQTGTEWRLVTGGKTLGSLPIYQPLYVGVLLIFAGRRWKVTGIDERARVVELEKATGGNPPMFGGGAAAVSDRVRAAMVDVYRSSATPAWLDAKASSLLDEARQAWHRLDLGRSPVLSTGSSVTLFPWVGDKALFTAAIALMGVGIEASAEGPSLELTRTSPSSVASAIRGLLAQGQPSRDELAALIQNTEIDKWDWVLDETLAREAAGARLLDVEGAWRVFASVAPHLASNPNADNSEPTQRELSGNPSQLGPAIGDLATRPSVKLPAPTLMGHEYCVLDLETTGFSPRLGDRVVEVATVRMRGDGTVISEWSTLIDPQRDIGATHVHGITAADVAGAPRFVDVVGDILRQMDGAVLVAHNFRFDSSFLTAEFARAGVDLPTFPALCTLSLGPLVHPGATSRRLSACCEDLGVALSDAHSALGDARATAGVLAEYLRLAAREGLDTLSGIGCEPLEWPEYSPPPASRSQVKYRGESNARIGEQGEYLSRLVASLPSTSGDDPDTAAYLALLDRALEDRRLTTNESDALAATATEWGLDVAGIRAAHDEYFDALLAVAAADGVITSLERSDLVMVASLLAIARDDGERRISDAMARAWLGDFREARSGTLVGLSVCFTGALNGQIGGQPITRAEAERLAEDAGMVVRSNVSKGLDVLVVADPDTQSGKARRARELGIRVMAEAAFWAAIGAETQ